jgi:hypothetical protein
VLPAHAATVKLQLLTDPPGATVLLDGERLGPAPVTIEVPRADRPGRLKARRKGYLPRSMLIPLAADGTFTIHLPRAD